MTTIKLKFELGQTVFLMNDNTVKTGEIIGISLTRKMDNNFIAGYKEELSYEVTGWGRKEDCDIFKTKAELLKDL